MTGSRGSAAGAELPLRGFVTPPGCIRLRRPMRVSRFAQATAVATYGLLIAGSLVHGTGSSLACPDWPLCHGTAFPAMEHGVEFEHTHRLIAGAVTVMTTMLAILLLRDRRYRALRS